MHKIEILKLSSSQNFLQIPIYYWYYKLVLVLDMYYLSSFAIGGFVPSAAIAGVLLLVGLGAFFYLGIKGPTDY